MRIGDVVGVIRRKDCEIRKRVAWVAYARNGNAGNPTVTYEWDVYDGAKMLDRFSRLRDAKAAIDNGDYR